MLTEREVVDHYFLETRCQLLEIAASLDRYDVAAARNASSGAALDPRWQKVYRALEILAQPAVEPQRAETLLRLFSDPTE